jgi:hypothetical protein
MSPRWTAQAALPGGDFRLVAVRGEVDRRRASAGGF